jgi:ribosomal protein S18 acetylase RimI-like enzyme
MKNIKLLRLLVIINSSQANNFNIISHDTYTNDILYCNKNGGAKIANFKEKHVSEFAELFLENSKFLYRGKNPKKFIGHLIKNKDQDIWGSDFKNKLNIMSCSIDKKLVGFVCYIYHDCTCPKYQLNNEMEDIPKAGYIALLCVDKNYRQQRIGTLLMYKAINELFAVNNVKYVTVMTTLDNEPAKNIYEKIGFTKVNEDITKKTVSYKLEKIGYK